MSSIISDIFYGSKQNLLDNYLINRFEKEPSLSIPQHKTAIYSSSLQFTIIVPLAKDENQKYYQISVQMGKRMDQVIVSIGGNSQPSEIVLALNDLESLDLSLYSNIKITISEGKYKNKVFGYIPIETVKSLISQQGGEKAIVLPMKGKHFIGFNSIKCTIKGEFIQNNILNSNILASVNKDNSELSHFNTENRQNNQDMSQIQQPFQNAKNTKPGIKRQYVKKTNYRKSSQQSHQYDRSNSKDFKIGSGLPNKLKATTQYIREVTTVAILFRTIKLNKQKEIQGVISLKHGALAISIGQEALLNNLTKQGVNIEIQRDGTKLGSVHLNALFLTMEDFKGELPIYGQNQQFIGTISVCSPSAFVAKNLSTCNGEFPGKKQNSVTINQQRQRQTAFSHSKQFKELLVIKIEKIVMTNTSNQLNNDSIQNIDRQKLQLFDFVKMQAHGRLQLIIRVNNQTYKFDEISVRYIIDCGQIQVVEFKRRQEFIIHSFQTNTEKDNVIEVELYSNHRLLCYSKSSISHQNMASHHFVAAQTNFRYSQCALYLKFIDLRVHEDYFHQSRIKYIIDILQKLLKGQIQITDLSDEGIKRIMNVSKKITYVEVKKLFTLIHKQFQKLVAFQKAKVESVFKNQLDKNQLIAKLNAKILRQFALIDSKGESAIQNSQFDSVIEFFAGDEQEQAIKEYKLLVSYCVKTKDNKILYPLFIAGLYLIKQTSQPGYRSQQASNSQTLKLQDQVVNQKQTIKQEILTNQLCFIQKISFSNLHVLNLGKIPNVVLNIAKKVNYSNANPQFVIQKQINLMQPIKIYHKNIALNNLTLLGEFQAVKRRSLYQIDISGKATAKIIWGH